jgi:hypothetical protein
LSATALRFSAKGLGRYIVHGKPECVLAMSATIPETDLFIEVELA